ncbi:MAG TPA: hypothetical protein VJJ47_01505 [Candidatus Paceibacterota bacterium]
MREHHKLLVGGLVAVLLAATVVPALAATNRGDIIAAVNRIVSTFNVLIDDQADIADRVEKLKIAGSTDDRAEIAADVRELKAKLENAQASIVDLKGKINNLRLVRQSSAANNEADLLQVSCTISNLRPKVGDTVTYEADVEAGSAKGATYNWTGDFTGVSKIEKFYFTGTGTFDARVTVKNQKGEAAFADCPKVVVAPNPPGSAGSGTRATGAAVTVVGPADGASLKIGKEATISWKHRGLNQGERLNISLRGAAGVQYFVRTSQPQGANGVGSYIWASVGTAPNAFVPAGSYTLQVCTDDGVLCGVSSVKLVAS